MLLQVELAYAPFALGTQAPFALQAYIVLPPLEPPDELVPPDVVPPLEPPDELVPPDVVPPLEPPDELVPPLATVTVILVDILSLPLPHSIE
jgi:hypothetical protein